MFFLFLVNLKGDEKKKWWKVNYCTARLVVRRIGLINSDRWFSSIACAQRSHCFVKNNNSRALSEFKNYLLEESRKHKRRTKWNDSRNCKAEKWIRKYQRKQRAFVHTLNFPKLCYATDRSINLYLFQEEPNQFCQKNQLVSQHTYKKGFFKISRKRIQLKAS